ncbi:hypothetical protein BGZ76_002385, partial [Entomortierella beljakovae]
LMETYLSTVGKGKAHGTYYVSRKDSQTGNQVISLVRQEELDRTIKDPNVIGYHIYSLEPAPLKDISTLTVTNAAASQLQQGKDINSYRIVKNKDIVISKSKRSTPVSKQTSTKESKPSAMPLTPNPTPASSSNTNTSTSNSKSKPANAKASMMSFFGKAASAAPKVPTSTLTSTTNSAPIPKAKTGTLDFKPVAQKRKAGSMMSGSVDTKNSPRDKVDEASDEVDSEEERDRRLALNSRLDQSTVVDPKKNTHKEPEALDINAIKKKQRNARLLAVDDDDEVEDEHYITQKPISEDGEDEDDDDDFATMKALSSEAKIALNNEKEKQRLALEKMMLQADEDIPMADAEIVDHQQDNSEPQSPASHTKATSLSKNTTPGRRRGHRAVTKKKTTVNGRGYMVTEDVVVMESFSEDEEPPARPPPPPPRVEKQEPTKTKSESNGPKKKPGSGNQTLLNFFKKQ